MNGDDTDNIQLLMWIEKLEQKISRLEREVIDIKSSLKKTARDDVNEEFKKINIRLAAMETATHQFADRTGKVIK